MPAAGLRSSFAAGLIFVLAGAFGTALALKICLVGCCRFVGDPEFRWVMPFYGCLLRCAGSLMAAVLGTWFETVIIWASMGGDEVEEAARLD